MMLPDRINLFRAQAIRSMGANMWRTAHNPPEPGLLDILGALSCTYVITSSQRHSSLFLSGAFLTFYIDRVGVMAMDENKGTKALQNQDAFG